MKKNFREKASYFRYVAPVVALASFSSCEDEMLKGEQSDEKNSTQSSTIPNNQPNIILIMADDMGRDDMSYRGNTAVSTPRLDDLAKKSTRFENFYVHSVSAPTRASLLTGRHFLRCGVSGVHAGRDYVNRDEVMIGEALQSAGYKTGMWGKWHSGETNGYYPWQRGFDEAYMATLYHHDYNNGKYKGYYDGKYYNGQVLPLTGWTDEHMTDMAIDFITRNKDEKFFAYVPYLSVHANWKAPEDYITPYTKKGQDTNFATLNGMLTHMDHQVGRIMDAVEDLGLSENTIIIFMSDNGPNFSGIDGNHKLDPNTEWKQRNPSGFSGNKSTNLENGIRSPFFVYWKGHTQAADNYSQLSVSDIFPTLCDAAGAPIPSNCKPLDGKSFYNLFTSPSLTDNSRTIYISHWTPLFDDSVIGSASDSEVVLTEDLVNSLDPSEQRIGIIDANYKFLYNETSKTEYFLIDLKNDPTESSNLYYKTADTKATGQAYVAKLKAWYDSVLADDGAFTIPAFLIDCEKGEKLEIPAYAPTKTSGEVTNGTLKITGFDKAGESATYAVDVVREAKYYMRLKTSTKNDAQNQVFTVSTNLKSNCGEIKWSSNYESQLVTLELTKDVTEITITLKNNCTATDLKLLSFQHKSDLIDTSGVPLIPYK